MEKKIPGYSSKSVVASSCSRAPESKALLSFAEQVTNNFTTSSEQDALTHTWTTSVQYNTKTGPFGLNQMVRNYGAEPLGQICSSQAIRE